MAAKSLLRYFSLSKIAGRPARPSESWMSFPTTIAGWLCTDYGPANMAIIRHTALNLIHAIKDKASVKARQKTVGWDDDDFFNATIQSWT